MRDTSAELYRKQYMQLRALFIRLCLDSRGRYCFNIFSMITLLYHLYIHNEIYHMTYNKIRNRLNDNLSIELTISKWDDYSIF